MQIKSTVAVMGTKVKLSVHVLGRRIVPVTCVHCEGRGYSNVFFGTEDLEICEFCKGTKKTDSMMINTSEMEAMLVEALDKYIEEKGMAQ